MDPTCLPRKFLTAWVSHHHWQPLWWTALHTAKLICGSRHFSIFSQIFQTMVPSIHGCPLCRTMKSGWKTLRTEWMKCWQALLTIYQYDPHPLLGEGILDHQFLWYLQDIHRRFSINSGHVWSIFLCFYYVIVLPSLWGHKPCIGFFFGDSMHLMLLYVIQPL
jgi:hypothetical protein